MGFRGIQVKEAGIKDENMGGGEWRETSEETKEKEGVRGSCRKEVENRQKMKMLGVKHSTMQSNDDVMKTAWNADVKMGCATTLNCWN